MRAPVVHHAHFSISRAKRDELLPQQQEPHGIAVRAQFRGERCRDPIAPHESAHGSAGPCLRENIIVKIRDHVHLSICS